MSTWTILHSLFSDYTTNLLIALFIADSVLDEGPPFEMRYSIDTPEPTPPSSPPQAVSVQTSLTELALEAKVCI